MTFPFRFTHLTVTLQQPRMSKDLLRQRKVEPSGKLASKSYGILPIVIIIVAILTIISYLVSKSVIASYSENLLSSSIQNQGNEIEAWLNENLSAFQAIKHNIEQTKPNDAQLQTLLDQYYDYNSNYPDGLYLADGQGNLMTASASSKSEQNPTSSVWYTEGLTLYQHGLYQCLYQF